MPSSTSSAPAASGVTSPRIFRPRAPSGGTSTSGDTTAPSKPSTTYFAARSARAEKPYSPRTSASVDSQSVDTTSGGEQRGRDNAKNVDGRKRHIVVDSMGLLMAVRVTAASIDDAKAAAELFARLDGQPMSHVKRMYADSKYDNFILYEWVETNAAWELNIVRTPEGCSGLGAAADSVDGGADVRVAGEMPSVEQGPREERPIVGGIRQVGYDPLDAQPACAKETDAEFHYRKAA